MGPVFIGRLRVPDQHDLLDRVQSHPELTVGEHAFAKGAAHSGLLPNHRSELDRTILGAGSQMGVRIVADRHTVDLAILL